MTCVIGLVDNEQGVIMGADSAGSDGHRISTYKAPKVWRHECRAGVFLFGVAGSYLPMQVIRHNFDPPRVVEGQDLDEYMVSEFVPALRESLRQAGCDGKDGAEASMGIGNVLVGFRGRLFEIQSNFTVLESSKGFMAIGSGTDYAMGCLYGNEASSLDGVERIRQALVCAESFVTTVRGPFTVSALEGAKWE